MDITACPKCGSKRIFMGTMSAGVTWGVTSWKSVCRDCGYQGEPLIFESEEAYRDFLKASFQKTDAGEKAGGEQTAEPQELTKDEEKLVEFVKEIQEEEAHGKKPREDGVFKKDKVWWPEIGVSMVLAAAWIILTLQNYVSGFGTVGAALYSVLFFVLLTIVFMVIIVIIEFFTYSIKRVITK